MMLSRRIMMALLTGLLGLRGEASAQELGEVCPDAQPGTGALWGLVSDAESGIGLPGATVVVTWEGDDQARVEAQTALDGGYVLCHVPLGVELSVRPVLANLNGPAVVVTLADNFLQVDLSFTDAGDDRVWACLGERADFVGLSRLLRCDSDWERLDACPHEEHGEVEANLPAVSRIQRVSASELARIRAEMQRSRGLLLGSGPGFREGVEKLVADAKRLGANALIDWDRAGARLTASAVTITVDPATCD